MSLKTVIIITGPTASGKTDLALEVATRLDTAIISADSRQCFRELNIGVSKPTAAQLSAVPHYFINSHSIHEPVNAAIFDSLAMQWCSEIFQTHDVVVMSGGTGLYIQAFRDGLDLIPEISAETRRQISIFYREQGLAALQETIRLEDPLFYSSGELLNPQRVMRALEVVRDTGRSILSFHLPQKKQLPYRILEFGISRPRKELYERINSRVDGMMSAGLLDEVISLQDYRHLNALRTVGYTELFNFLAGECSLEESVLRIKQNTRHYAKRQITWFNRNDNLIWLEGADGAEQILSAYADAKI